MSTEKPMTKTTAAGIKARRQAFGITQQEAAELVGVTLKGWQHYEYGVREIPVPTWRLFCILTIRAPRAAAAIRRGLKEASC